MKIEYTVSIGLVGCKQKGTIDLSEYCDDFDLDEDAINDIVYDHVMTSVVEWNWKEIEE